jgi:hypothetical protein
MENIGVKNSIEKNPPSFDLTTYLIGSLYKKINGQKSPFIYFPSFFNKLSMSFNAFGVFFSALTTLTPGVFFFLLKTNTLLSFRRIVYPRAYLL